MKMQKLLEGKKARGVKFAVINRWKCFRILCKRLFFFPMFAPIASFSSKKEKKKEKEQQPS